MSSVYDKATASIGVENSSLINILLDRRFPEHIPVSEKAGISNKYLIYWFVSENTDIWFLVTKHCAAHA